MTGHGALLCLLVATGMAPLMVGAWSSPQGKASAMAQLPEGSGLAARYPGDTGIARHRAVLFADGFESVSGSRLTDGLVQDAADKSRWNHAWDHAWGGCEIARQPGAAHSGTQCLQMTTVRPQSVGLSKYLPKGYDRLFLRYYVRYASDFPGAHHVGGAIEARAPGVPHAHAGVPADGRNKISVLLDHWTLEDGIKPPGPLVAYVYHMDQRHQWGEQFYPSGKIQPQENERRRLFGSDFKPRPDLIPERDRWYCFELMVELGEPGTRGGRVAFWVDGKLRADFPNLRFRTTPDLKLNRVDVALYESRDTGTRRVWFDDVVVATEYIGPMRATADK